MPEGLPHRPTRRPNHVFPYLGFLTTAPSLSLSRPGNALSLGIRSLGSAAYPRCNLALLPALRKYRHSGQELVTIRDRYSMPNQRGRAPALVSSYNLCTIA